MKYNFFKGKSLVFFLFFFRISTAVTCFLLVVSRLVGVYMNVPKNMLIEATKASDVVVVRDLLKKGSFVDAVDLTDREFTNSLFLAAINIPNNYRYIDIIKVLINFYTKMNEQNWRGETALHAITLIENFDVLLDTFTLLFLHGCNIDLKDKEGNTVLEEFVRSNYRGAIDILLKNYADIFGLKRIDSIIKKAQEYMFTDLELIVNGYKSALVNNQFIPANSAFLDEQLRCILRGDAEKLQDNEIRLVKDIFGNNQLHYAVRLGNNNLIGLLLKKLPKLAYTKNISGIYPLHVICVGDYPLEEQKNMLTLFEKYGINLNQQDGYGSTIVHILIKKRNFELIKFIMKNFKSKINLSLKDSIQGETPRELLKRLDVSRLAVFD